MHVVCCLRSLAHIDKLVLFGKIREISISRHLSTVDATYLWVADLVALQVVWGHQRLRDITQTENPGPQVGGWCGGPTPHPSQKHINVQRPEVTIMSLG
jgi:hypothetical protein